MRTQSVAFAACSPKVASRIWRRTLDKRGQNGVEGTAGTAHLDATALAVSFAFHNLCSIGHILSLFAQPAGSLELVKLSPVTSIPGSLLCNLLCIPGGQNLASNEGTPGFPGFFVMQVVMQVVMQLVMQGV
jgi:hypothetical protein